MAGAIAVLGALTWPSVAQADWQTVPSPSPWASADLASVSASSSTNVWAAGTYENAYSVRRAMMLRYNGSAWQVVAFPNPGYRTRVENDLSGVLALSRRDAWAVGVTMKADHSRPRPLIEHWNGTTWQQVTLPWPATQNGAFQGICRVAGANRLWAVGYVAAGGRGFGLIAHYDGRSWHARWVLRGSLELSGCVAAPNRMRAVGLNSVVRWNGRTMSLTNWKTGNVFDAIAADDPTVTGGWIVGVMPSCCHAAAMRFGSSRATSGIIGDGFARGVAAAPNDAWAVGDSYAPSPRRALIAHWDGSTWTPVARTPYWVSLESVARVPGTNGLWAVGSLLDPGTGDTTTVTMKGP
jgi:hypothetical protein